ncbi:SUN domain-containing protein 3-like [Neopsephotus bourkii]|uniref:SUN domain-containing protein 3-like n=1 Tax=Neopsephotus bourkii TaxID=309878 RepID=UPI002AA566F2|nr:SUN domain-containing protein 3-like [Neopsephotus bourkii]
MQQSQSEVLIRLPTEVQPTAITLQYCSKTATPLVTVSSAPKDFTVSGLDEEGQGETLLGSFLYSVQKEPTQTFPLQVQWVRVGRRPGQKHQFASKSLARGEWTVPGRTGA